MDDEQWTQMMWDIAGPDYDPIPNGTYGGMVIEDCYIERPRPDADGSV